MSVVRTANEVWHRLPEAACEMLLIDDPARPVVAVALVLTNGCVDDPPGKEGLAYLTGQMLMRGCAAWDQAALADEIDYLGASLGVTVGRETMTLSGEVLSRNLDALEALITGIIGSPTFPEDELEKLKRRTVAEIAQVVDSDAAVGQRHYIRTMFGAHAYGRPLKGTTASVNGITRDDVVACYEQRVGRRGAFVAASGDITLTRLTRLVNTTVGPLAEQAASKMVVGPAPKPKGVSAVLVDKPDRSQTQVFIGHPSVHAQHPDGMALHVAQTYFGGTFTSVLTQEIREKRGWSYTAHASLSADRHLGTFTLRFAPSVKDTVDAISLAHDLLLSLRDDGPSDEDVAFAKKYLTNSHPFSLDTPGRQLHERLMARLQGRADTFVDEYLQMLAATTPADVRAATARHIDPDNLIVGLVCTAADLRNDVTAWAPVSDDQIRVVAHDIE